MLMWRRIHWREREREREREKEMWKNVGVNITTQQKKLNQQDSCLITWSLVCMGYSDACYKRQTNT